MSAFTEISLVANPNPAAPLCALLQFHGECPECVTLEADGGAHRVKRVYQAPGPGPIPVVGFRAGQTYEAAVTAQLRGERITRKFTLTMPPLPHGENAFPSLAVKRDAMAQESGWTMINPRLQMPTAQDERERGKIDQAALRMGLLVLLDEEGKVVWLYNTDSRITYFTEKNGHIYFGTAANVIYEIDWMGNVVSRWCPARRPDGKPVAPGAHCQFTHSKRSV